MWNAQKKTEKKQSEKTKKVRNYYRAYMSSYEWNFMVLEIVDYLEETLFDENGNVIESISSDPWFNFKTYCQSQHLNWKVLKKMIGHSVTTHFKSEMDLARHEAFKAIEENYATLPAEKDEDTSVPIETKENLSVSVEKTQDSNVPTEEKAVISAAELECAFIGLSENLSSLK
jgi:hypothetical protein